MTNEERSALIAQGWMPPVAVDPDLVEAEAMSAEFLKELGPYWRRPANSHFLKAIKRGRELERIASGNYAIITRPEDAA